MTVNTTWVNPNTTLNLTVGDTLTETWSDGLASNLNFLGGSDGKSGYVGSKVNLLVNGGFEFWQRGIGPFTTSTYGPDRWANSIVPSDTLSVSPDSSTNVDAGSRLCAKAVFVLNGGAGSTSIYQQIKDGDGT